MRAVLISCSNVKKTVNEPSPAYEVYDGPYFKTIKKLKREGLFPDSVNIYIISAKYGLLQLEDPILNYDERITREKASVLNKSIVYNLAKEISDNRYTQLIVNLGSDYMPSISGLEDIIPSNCHLVEFTGTIIQRRKLLKEYLLDASG